MDLDDDELRATKKLNCNKYMNYKIKKVDEKDRIIYEMAHDLLHFGERPYYMNIFNEEQIIDCYKRKVQGDEEWYINK